MGTEADNQINGQQDQTDEGVNAFAQGIGLRLGPDVCFAAAGNHLHGYTHCDHTQQAAQPQGVLEHQKGNGGEHIQSDGACVQNGTKGFGNRVYRIRRIHEFFGQNLNGNAAGNHTQQAAEPDYILKQDQRDGAKNVKHHGDGGADPLTHGSKGVGLSGGIGFLRVFRMGDRLGLCSNPGDHLGIAFLFAFALQDQTVIEVQRFLKELLPAVFAQSGAGII